MKRIIVLLILACSITMTWAQSRTKTRKVEVIPGGTVIKKVYEMNDQGVEWPVFPGGEKALMEYLSREVKYPADAQNSHIEGRVLCRFVVKEDGSISDIEVVKSVFLSLDEEVVRIVKSMPKWTPGTKDGWPINVRYTLPVSFRLRQPAKDTLTVDRPQPASSKDVAGGELVMPSFPGGKSALFSYLTSTVKYPAKAIKDGTAGRVVCDFVVDVDGSITDVAVSKGVSPELDAEAVRVVESMPKWIPGHRGGKKEKVRMFVPITFRL